VLHSTEPIQPAGWERRVPLCKSARMVTESDWAHWVTEQLESIRTTGRWRSTRTLDSFGPSGRMHGTPVVNFASNDYLGLSAHPAVIDAAHAALDHWGAGSTASRLIVGSRPCHEELEAEIAAWKHTDRAVLFSSGYAANVGVLSVLGAADVTILSDELNHASIIDGCRLSRAQVRTYRHVDLDHLGDLMTHTPGRKVVVTDAVFSMDGDVAPVDGIVAICNDADALLVLDEAHSVLGPHVAATDGNRVVRVGTLSKTLGSLGGWVACSNDLADLLVNRARSFIFTTALSPADAASALAALAVVRSEEGAALVAHLCKMIERIAPGHSSPIVPIMLGDEGSAVDASARLLDRGILVPAIRPPTVPVGTSRLRVAMSAAHTEEMVAALIDGLAGLQLRPAS
jgi:8-amino-7-oxononanoate synthase